MLKQQIEQDLKTALLARDSTRATTLRGLKSVILYAEVAQNKREAGLNDDEIAAVLAKEAQKRQESADLYVRGGNQAKADDELKEKELILAYLPKQLSEEELAVIIEEQVNTLKPNGPQDMGKVIGAVKSKAGASADGATIAKLVKERLS